MPTVFEKLNLKDQNEILVLNAPDSFEPELATLDDVTVKRKAADVKAFDFAVAFVTRQQEVDDFAKIAGRKAQGDAILWFAYPKGTSKKYRCEFNRDNGWKAVGAAGFEPVRMVAIDADWTALRFRRAEYIKSMKRGREHAISSAGKKKARG